MRFVPSSGWRGWEGSERWLRVRNAGGREWRQWRRARSEGAASMRSPAGPTTRAPGPTTSCRARLGAHKLPQGGAGALAAMQWQGCRGPRWARRRPASPSGSPTGGRCPGPASARAAFNRGSLGPPFIVPLGIEMMPIGTTLDRYPSYLRQLSGCHLSNKMKNIKL